MFIASAIMGFIVWLSMSVLMFIGFVLLFVAVYLALILLSLLILSVVAAVSYGIGWLMGEITLSEILKGPLYGD